MLLFPIKTSQLSQQSSQESQQSPYTSYVQGDNDELDIPRHICYRTTRTNASSVFALNCHPGPFGLIETQLAPYSILSPISKFDAS